MLLAAFYLGGDFNEKRSIIYDFGGFYNSNSAALLLLQRGDGHFFLRGSAELQMLPGIFIGDFYMCNLSFLSKLFSFIWRKIMLLFKISE